MTGGLVDRRSGTRSKNLPNRQKFVRRLRDQIKESAKDAIGERSIKDVSEQEVGVPRKDVSEPTFQHSRDSGDYDYVLPGNKEYVPGDSVNKPQEGQGGGRKSKGGKGDKGYDEFRFKLTFDEYLDVIFEGLELPRLLKKAEATLKKMQMRRAGFTPYGIPANLNVPRTVMSALGRRIALKAPLERELEELGAELDQLHRRVLDENLSPTDPVFDRIEELTAKISELQERLSSVGYFADTDLRFNNYVPQPRRITRAVMFCLMDVSGSMQEREKTIAKKFFVLLYLFLRRRYEDIEVVFVRHTHEAEVVDEDTFFHDPSTGGTVISSGLREVERQVREKYDPDSWNVYLAQVSDGDNDWNDEGAVKALIDRLMKVVQYMAYLEVGRDWSMWGFSDDGAKTVYGKQLAELQKAHENLAIQMIKDELDVVKVFRKFFAQGEK